tara:strand:- start:586 stop:912 length:327 start_codon:yes stop_codon:yes gene_type:complete
MKVSQLIKDLRNHPAMLMEELIQKRTELCLERDILERKIINLNKVIRICVDVKCRHERNNEEIGNLHDELIGPSGTHTEEDRELDLSNLYILSGTRLEDEDMNTKTDY